MNKRHQQPSTLKHPEGYAQGTDSKQRQGFAWPWWRAGAVYGRGEIGAY
ncbi:MAG: hypothetical protein P8Y80_13840 [Acidobacteriota bacterium]